MPHESTVDPEEPMHFKSWGEEKPQIDYDRRRSTYGQIAAMSSRLSHSLSIQTHPDLPLRVTHDHDDDGDPDDDIAACETDGIDEYRSRVQYTPPKRKTEETVNGENAFETGD